MEQKTKEEITSMPRFFVFGNWAFFIWSWYSSTRSAARTYSFFTRRGFECFLDSASATYVEQSNHVKNAQEMQTYWKEEAVQCAPLCIMQLMKMGCVVV